MKIVPRVGFGKGRAGGPGVRESRLGGSQGLRWMFRCKCAVPELMAVMGVGEGLCGAPVCPGSLDNLSVFKSVPPLTSHMALSELF